MWLYDGALYSVVVTCLQRLPAPCPGQQQAFHHSDVSLWLLSLVHLVWCEERASKMEGGANLALALLLGICLFLCSFLINAVELRMQAAVSCERR